MNGVEGESEERWWRGVGGGGAVVDRCEKERR